MRIYNKTTCRFFLYIFADDCAASEACAGGIYTAETYDAITIIGKATIWNKVQTWLNISIWSVLTIQVLGVIDFDAVGDIPGAGYDICVHAVISQLTHISIVNGIGL